MADKPVNSGGIGFVGLPALLSTGLGITIVLGILGVSAYQEYKNG